MTDLELEISECYGFSLVKKKLNTHTNFNMKYKYVSKNFKETMETNSKAIKSTTMVEE